MSKQKMLAARELIQEKRYAEARALLKTIDDPTAKAWLKKLDAIAPEKKKSGGMLIYITTAVVLVSVAIIVVTFITRQNNANQNAVAQAPTQMELPSATPTFTPSDTHTWTPSPIPTDTALPTETPSPTATLTPSPTDTPLPSATFTSTLTPTPNFTLTVVQRGMTLTAIANDIAGFQTGTFQANLQLTPSATHTPLPTNTPSLFPQTGQIGPIWDSLYDETFNVDIVLREAQFSRGDQFSRPSSGNTYVLLYVTVNNLGPGTLRNISSYTFQMMDSYGAVRNSTWVFFTDCDFPLVNLPAGGSVSGCIAFEAPSSGQLHFIYAPFQYEGMVPGRYIDMIVRH